MNNFWLRKKQKKDVCSGKREKRLALQNQWEPFRLKSNHFHPNGFHFPPNGFQFCHTLEQAKANNLSTI